MLLGYLEIQFFTATQIFLHFPHNYFISYYFNFNMLQLELHGDAAGKIAASQF